MQVASNPGLINFIIAAADNQPGPLEKNNNIGNKPTGIVKLLVGIIIWKYSIENILLGYD